MTGKQVLASVTAIILATAVLPPAAAWAVNRQRVMRAQGEAAAIAETLSGRRAELARVRAAAGVLAGPGEMPAADAADVQMWVLTPRASLEVVLPGTQASPDPWGNAYLVDISPDAGPGEARIRALSAGPNGIIETAFGADRTAGDDIVGTSSP